MTVHGSVNKQQPDGMSHRGGMRFHARVQSSADCPNPLTSLYLHLDSFTQFTSQAQYAALLESEVAELQERLNAQTAAMRMKLRDKDQKDAQITEEV